MDTSESVHPETLEEKAPAFIVEYFQFGLGLISAYGWYLLGAALVSLWAWNSFESTYQKWKRQRDDSEYAARYHKNPDLARSRQEAIDAARRRMQEEHDRQAQVCLEKAKEREEQKREEWVRRQTGAGASAGHTLAGSSRSNSEPGPSKKSNNFRPEYNPLMGSGSSGGYRPPKRGCPGGGCGKK